MPIQGRMLQVSTHLRTQWRRGGQLGSASSWQLTHTNADSAENPLFYIHCKTIGGSNVQSSKPWKKWNDILFAVLERHFVKTGQVSHVLVWRVLTNMFQTWNKYFTPWFILPRMVYSEQWISGWGFSILPFHLPQALWGCPILRFLMILENF